MRPPSRIEIVVIFVLVGVLGLLLLVSRANGATIQQDYELAGRYWHTPPAGCSSVEVGTLQPREEPDSVGEATTTERGAAPVPCVFQLAEATFPYERCVLAIHEYGHLLGLDHSPDPSSVMFYRSGEQRVQMCVEQYRREGWTKCRARHPDRGHLLHVCAMVVFYAKPWVYGY